LPLFDLFTDLALDGFSKGVTILLTVSNQSVMEFLREPFVITVTSR